MHKIILVGAIVGAVVGTAGAGLGTASMAATYEAQGHTFTYPDFQPETFQTTIATDAAGHKMRLFKMKNGHMMVLVPADPYMALYSPRNEDMLQ